jgi:putative ABC transport system ATP-binding protein
MSNSETDHLQAMTKSAVHLEDLSFGYKPEQPVLRIKELSIPSGQRVFLYGPSGSGKTTFLSVISGVLVPQQGTVTVLGQDLTRISASARDTLRGSQIGYIFQGFNLIPYLTVAENIALPCDLHRARRAQIGTSTVGEEVRRLAHRLGIHTQLDASVTNLSMGQQQRVAIARAIIGAPELVIADEPTSSLDTDARDAFLDLLNEAVDTAEARDGVKTTLLFVSHDRSLARHFDKSVSITAFQNDNASFGEIAR